MNKKKIISILAGSLILLFLILDIVIIKSNPDLFKAVSQSNNPSKTIDNLYPVSYEDRTMFIDKNGEEIFTLKNSDYDVIGSYNEGFLLAGKTVTSVSSTEFSYDVPSYSILQLSLFNNKGEKVNSIKQELKRPNGEGEPLIPSFHNGQAEITLENNGTACINTNGNQVECGSNTNAISIDTSNNIHSFISNGMLGYKDNDGQIIIEASLQPPPITYSEWKWDPEFHNGRAIIFKNETVNNETVYKCGVINTKGKIVVPPVYDYISPFYDDITFVENSKIRGYINKKGKLVWSEKRD